MINSPIKVSAMSIVKSHIVFFFIVFVACRYMCDAMWLREALYVVVLLSLPTVASLCYILTNGVVKSFIVFVKSQF